MYNMQRIFHIFIISIVFFAPATALALSDMDTTFSVHLYDRNRKLRCNYLAISNGKLKCTNGSLVEQIPISSIKQLDVVYMGKEYNDSEIDESDINSVTAMSIRKEQAALEQQDLRAAQRRQKQALQNKKTELQDPKTRRMIVCKEFASIAGSIMKKRQDEVPIYKLLEVAQNQKNEFTEPIGMMVEMAYTERAMRTPANRIRQQNEFSNKIFRQCYSSKTSLF